MKDRWRLNRSQVVEVPYLYLDHSSTNKGGYESRNHLGAEGVTGWNLF